MKQITVLFLLFSNILTAQNFEKSYRSWWGDTMWEFNFRKNGTFNRVSAGHYGSTDVKGKYLIAGDTLTILKGYKNTNATISQKYVIDIDGNLIDTKLLVEYWEIPNPDTVSTFFEVKRKLQQVSISDNHGHTREMLRYYGPDNRDPDKIRKQLYYFLRYTKLLPGAAEKIYAVSHIKPHENPELTYDKSGRIQSYSFFHDRGQNVVLQRMYQFDYAEETGYKFTSITDMPWRFETIKYTFEYDINDNLGKIIETGEDGSIIRTFKFL